MVVQTEPTVSGMLWHNPDSTSIELHDIANQLSDFDLSVRFINPSTATNNLWDYGVLFRRTNSAQYRLVLEWDRDWVLLLRHGSNEIIQKGTLPNFNVGASEGNSFKLIVRGTRGAFFVNGQFISELDLSGHHDKGELSIGTGFYQLHEQPGAATGFENLTLLVLDPIPVPTYTPTITPTLETTLKAIATNSAPLAIETNRIANGTLWHNVDNTSIELYGIGNQLSDFDLSVDFVNPYAATHKLWDYGVLFRRTSSAQYRLIVDSDGKWALGLYREEFVILNSGRLQNIKTGANDDNSLRLIVRGTRGAFFVNGQFISELDLSGHHDKGELSIGTGFYEGNEQPGATTDFENLYLLLLDPIPVPTYTPSIIPTLETTLQAIATNPIPIVIETFPTSSGILSHNPDDATVKLYTFDTEVSDFDLSVDFINPYAPTNRPWDYGVRFRYTSSAQYRLILDSDGQWALYLRREGSRNIQEGTLTHFNIGENEDNRLRLIVRGTRGAFFINGQFITELDLSGHHDKGELSIGTGFYEGNEQLGAATGFGNLTLLVLDPIPLPTPTPSSTPIVAILAAHIGSQQGKIEIGGGEVWNFHGTVGDLVTIRVNADKPASGASGTERQERGLLDTLVIVRAPDGTVVADSTLFPSADDIVAAENTDSLIGNLTLIQDGLYEIEVRSWDNQTGGAYTLIIESSHAVDVTPMP